MGKTFRRDRQYNKFSRRDKKANKKFNEKFLQTGKKSGPKPVIPATEPIEDFRAEPEDFD